VGLQRKAEDVAAWKMRDPIARLAEALKASRGVTARMLSDIDAEIEEFVVNAQAYGRAGVYPDEAALLARVYAESASA